MKHTNILLLLIIVLALGCFGCTSTPVPGTMVSCTKGLTKEALEEPCSLPTHLKHGEPYETSLRISTNERVDLFKCAKKVEILQKAAADCDKKVEEYNRALKAIK